MGTLRDGAEDDRDHRAGNDLDALAADKPLEAKGGTKERRGAGGDRHGACDDGFCLSFR